MRIARPATFWIAVSAVALVALVLLHQILLPFVVGALLAYLLVPAVDRLERLGIGRSLAALAVFLPLLAGLVAFLLVMLPAIIGEVRFFVDEFPRYVTQLQSLVTDASSPWLRSVMGDELHIEQSSADVARTMGSDWLDGFLRSLWSSGLALISLLSLLVVTPIIAIYLAIDWQRMIATVDGWFAPAYRDDMRALVREIHDTVAGFVRGQTRHLSRSCRALCDSPEGDRAQPCHPDRHHRRPHQLCPLPRGRHRFPRGGVRCDRPSSGRIGYRSLSWGASSSSVKCLPTMCCRRASSVVASNSTRSG